MTDSEILENSVLRQLPLKIIIGCRDLKVRAEQKQYLLWDTCGGVDIQSQGISFSGEWGGGSNDVDKAKILWRIGNQEGIFQIISYRYIHTYFYSKSKT